LKSWNVERWNMTVTTWRGTTFSLCRIITHVTILMVTLSDTPGLTSCLLEFPPPLVLKENHHHHLHFPGEPGSSSNNCSRRQSLRIIGTVSLQASCHQHCQSTEGNQSTNPNKEIHLLASIYLAISNASSPMPVPMELWDVALSRQWTVNVPKATVNVIQSQFINKREKTLQWKCAFQVIRYHKVCDVRPETVPEATYKTAIQSC